MDAAIVAALTPTWVAGDATADAAALAALEADGRSDAAAVAADRQRRRARKGGGEKGADTSATAVGEAGAAAAGGVSPSPPLLPLVLLSHPSGTVRQAASAALAERIAAVPVRAPAALPPLLLHLRAAAAAAPAPTATTTTTTTTAAAAAAATAAAAESSAKALLAALHAAAAGAAHPLGAPVALRALAPLVTPPAHHFHGTAPPPDKRMHALSLRLLTELWRHHRGAFPRLKAALEHASSSREADVVVGAAAACAAAAAADPHGATELAGPLRACLESAAPVPARRGHSHPLTHLVHWSILLVH